MSKKVLFVVIGTGKIKDNTKSSIDANLGKEDARVFVKYDDVTAEQYYSLKTEINKVVNDVNNFDYVCLLPNGSELNEKAKDIFQVHQAATDKEFTGVYLPLVLYNTDITTVLNKHVWNSMIASLPGTLDIDLALNQIDSTIFGAFIPTNMFFDEKNYKADMKYYQQYFFLNSIAADENNIISGIPKILLKVTDEWDFKFASIEQEEKVKYFNLARENWSEENKLVTNPSK